MKHYLIQLGLLSVFITGCSVFGWVSHSSFSVSYVSHAQRAQELRNEHKFEEAVKEYHLHMAQRQAQSKQGKGENPNFYFLLIGDTYLENDRPEEAKEAYLTAYQNAVENNFIADRLLQLAQWYFAHQRGDEGIALLRQYRELDTLLIDNAIDQLHKKTLEVEDRNTSPG